MGTMAHEPALCTIKTPVTLQVGDVRTELGRPGVVVMDVVIPHMQTIDVSMTNSEWRGLTSSSSFRHYSPLQF